jgi:hypothetical protein
MPNHMENENENRNEVKDVLVFPSLEFKKLWEQWIEYKKDEHKDTYKSSKTEQIAINNLIKMSHNSLHEAEEILNFSIANKYKGLFVKYQTKKEINNNKLSQYTNWLDELNNNHQDKPSETNSEIKRLTF